METQEREPLDVYTTIRGERLNSETHVRKPRSKRKVRINFGEEPKSISHEVSNLNLMTIDFAEQGAGNASVYIRDAELLEARLIHKSKATIENAKQKLHSIVYRYHIYTPDEAGLEKLLTALKAGGSPNSTLANYFNVYRHWAACRGMPEIKPRKFKVDERKLPPYSKEEIHAIIRLVENTTKSSRDRALVALAAHTGLRRKEIRYLQVKDLIDEEGLPVRNLDDMVMVQVVDNGAGTKSHQARRVPITPELKVYLKEYIVKRNRGLVELGADAPWLFITRDGHQMSEDSVYSRIAKYVRALDIKKKGRCHSMRRYFITTLGKSNANMYKIQKLAGHASCDQTAAYMSYEDKDLIETMKTVKF